MAERRIATVALAIIMAGAWAVAARAADSPRTTWIKTKCAVCHGENGASDTPQGKRTHAPDLRTPEVQKLTDAELRASIETGHSTMPSFKASVTNDQVSALLYYIRSIALKK